MNENEKILVVDDEPQMQLALKTALDRRGYLVDVAANGKEALKLLEQGSYSLIVSDQRMPEMSGQDLLEAIQAREDKIPFIMITAHGTIDQAVKAMQLGAADFITKPFSYDDLLRLVERVLSPESKEYRENSNKESNRKQNTIITKDALMIKVLEVAEAVAKSDATVLVQGESGTGKEGISRFIHSMSARAKQPFVAVNCAALPETLLESELFGHEKGSFTGAQTSKLGKFELAHGGTILLDEISEMELGLQAKLLRVLQEREIDRVGGRQPISVDVRVIATTNRKLSDMVQDGKFREDLFYRLNVIPLTLPPLRERKGDVKLLIEHFMRQFMGNKMPQLTEHVLHALTEYNWPGNVRELQNAVQRASILAAGGSLQSSHFLINDSHKSLVDQITVESVTDDKETAQVGIRSGMTVHEMEKSLILETLKTTSNNRTRAAEMLGISIRTLRNKLNEYGLGRQNEA